MTERPNLPSVNEPAAVDSTAKIQTLADDLRLRRRKERSDEDHDKNNTWASGQAAELGTTLDHVEDVMVGAIVHDVHSLPDF